MLPFWEGPGEGLVVRSFGKEGARLVSLFSSLLFSLMSALCFVCSAVLDDWFFVAQGEQKACILHASSSSCSSSLVLAGSKQLLLPSSFFSGGNISCSENNSGSGASLLLPDLSRLQDEVGSARAEMHALRERLNKVLLLSAVFSSLLFCSLLFSSLFSSLLFFCHSRFQASNDVPPSLMQAGALGLRVGDRTELVLARGNDGPNKVEQQLIGLAGAIVRLVVCVLV